MAVEEVQQQENPIPVLEEIEKTDMVQRHQEHDLSMVQQQPILGQGEVLEIEQKDKDDASHNRQDQAIGPKFCEMCRSVDHIATECKKAWPQPRAMFGQGEQVQGKELSEMVARLCATQVPGQAFFVIPNCPTEMNARERINTTVVNVLKGNVTSRLIEEEFTRLLPES
jgi:hypothetical protein